MSLQERHHEEEHDDCPICKAQVKRLREVLGKAPMIYVDTPTGQILPGFASQYKAWLEQVRAALEPKEAL